MSHFFNNSNNEGAAVAIRRSNLVADCNNRFHTYNSTSVLKCQEGIFESGTEKKKKLNCCWMPAGGGSPAWAAQDA